MAGEIYFKSGSKSSITTQAPLTPSYKAGTVYFAVDNTDNGFIYLDYNNKRIPMTAVASKDSANNSIISTYMASVSFDSNSSSLIFKDGNNDTHSTVLLPFLLLTGGNVTGPVNFGDSVTTDELTAGSLIVNGVARFNNGLIGNLTGNADTATSAISATKDSSNHKIVDYYVHSIAHSNNTINYSNGNGDSLGSFAIPGAFFVKGTQTSSTNAWTGALPSGVTQYYEGLSIAYFLPYAGTSTAATLNLGGLGAKPIIIGENATSAATTHYAAKNVIWMTYLTDSSINSGNGYWKVSAHRNSTYYYTTAYCTTGAGTAAKAGNVSYYTLQPGYIPVMFSYDNTAQSALTLNINSTGAKPLYINGVASSSSNYTIPKDVYMVYYDGTNYYLRTDGVLPGKMERAVADGSGNNIQSTYANSLTLSGSTLTLKNKNGDKLSEVTIAASDTKVNVTLGTTTKAYILGTSTTPTGTATGVTSIADTGVYLGTTAGELVATKFTGDLAGNATSATSATSATNDSANHKITDHYVHSITTSSNTLTYKDGDGDQLGTASLVNSVSNAWTAGTTSGPKITTTVNGVDGTAVAIPSASASESGVVTTGAQTFAGSKTFNSKIIGNLQGNADSATKATNDGGGNEIESTYIKAISYSGNSSTNAAGSSITAGSAGLVTMTKGDDTTSKIDIPAATASIAGLVNNGTQTFAGTKTFSTGVTIASGTSTKAVFNYSDIQAGTSDAARPVWFAWAGQNGTPVIDTDFTYNPSTNTLKADKFDGLATKATGDSNGNNILSTYANSLTLSGNTLTLKNKNGDKLSEVTIAASDTKVNVTLGTTSKAYILGTTTTPTSTATGVTSIADTGVYLGTTAGELVATKFTGDLNGNAATATLASKATGDGNGNEIISKYASSLEASGTTLTLKAQNGDTLSTVTTQDTKNTAGSSQKATKIYIIGAESQATSAQTYSSSKVYITDGTVTATTFSGDLSGNATSATTATSATNDSANHKITDHYVHSITTSSNTLTYKDGDGDQLGTASLVNSVSNTWTAGTTAGPTIKTTVNGVAGTAVAIPSASASASGIVTTGAQTFAGSKTFNSKIIGNLQGNADTATAATNDSANHKITDHYVHSITSSSNTLTYKDGDGDQLGTATIINSVSNSWTAGTSTGPTLTTTVNGKSGTAVAIPSASASASGVVTTGAQTFAGSKTFNSKIIGNLQGNADTATSATNDSGSHKIIDYYIHSITFDSSTSKLTYKTGNDDPTDILLPFLLLTGGNVTGPVSFGDSVSIDTLMVGSLVSTGVATFNNGLIGNLTGNADTATKATQDSNGNNILNHYAHSLTSATNTLTLKNANGDTLSTANIVNSISNSWTDGTNAGPKIQITVNGQSSTAAAIPSASSSVSGVVTTGTQTFAGSKTFSSKIIGDLQGNADTATKATGDSSGNNILNFYAHSLSSSGNTLTLKNGNGDSLSTPSIVNSISNTWTDGTSAGPTLKTTVNGIAGTAVAIPSASSSVSGVVTTGAQTFAGVKTMSAALNLANNTANKIGDDVSLGDFNVAGTLGIQGLNGTTGIALIKQSESWATSANLAKISYDGSDVSITKPVKGFVTAAHYGGQSNSTKIKIQINSTTSWMLSFVVTLYQSYRATKIMISGYNYGTNHWYQPEARLIADSDGTETIATYFGYDSDWNLWIGFDGGDYTGVSITDVVNGYTQITDYSNLFTITNVSDLGGTTQATVTAASKADYANTAGEADHATTASGVKDYNNDTVTTFGYSTSGMDSTSWLGSWDGYKLRAISPANALKSAVGTTAIGGTAKPIYWTGSAFAALSASAGSTYVPVFLNSGTITACTSPSILVNLGSESATNVFAASPRPGVTGVLPVAHGGTGASSARVAFHNLSAGLTEGTAVPTDNTVFMCGNTDGSTNDWYYRKFSTVWSYIVDKLSKNSVVYEERLLWGNINQSGNFGVIDQVMNHKGRGNRFAGIPAAAVTIQYSTDGGSTWTTNAANDATKRGLFTTSTSLRLVPSGNVTNTSQLRIIVDTGAGSVYTNLKKFMIYLSTNYSNGCKVTIDAALQNAPNNYTLTICNNQPVSGWSGWNVINCDFTTYGNTATSQYGRIRFTFKHDSITSGQEANGLTVSSIYGYGGVGWTTPSTFALTDHIYSWDYALNATFPANVTASKVYGAVWNDYAEYRQIKEDIKPGKVVIETGNGDLKLSDRRLQPGANVVTDTFGFAIGETKTHKTPIAVSGRVLVYPYESIDEFRKHIGGPVCSGPDGTVSIMSINEERLYPSRIIGTVSEIPDYEEWGTDNIKVNGRIWIRIR